MIERFDPGRPGGGVVHRMFAYEHIQRYEIAASLIAMMPGDPGNRVVIDAACGVGYGSDILHGHGVYVGFDSDAATIQRCRDVYHGRQFYHIDLDSEGCFCDLTSDVIVSLETIEHLARPSAFLSSAYAALPPSGGLLILSAPTSLTMDFDPYHKRDWGKWDWARTICDSGFKVQSMIDMPFETGFWAFTRTVGTTWRQKWQVVRFLLANRDYLKDRFLNWGLRNRFYWCSTMFICKKS